MNAELKSKTLDILLVEDNPDDVLLTELAIKESDIQGSFTLANNGKAALEILNDTVNTGERLPDLILLDINLPKVNGLEVLKEIKSNKSTSSIPTVVFTSSDAMSDMRSSYENGAELYIRKPNNIQEYKKIMKYIVENSFRF